MGAMEWDWCSWDSLHTKHPPLVFLAEEKQGLLVAATQALVGHYIFSTSQARDSWAAVWWEMKAAGTQGAQLWA